MLRTLFALSVLALPAQADIAVRFIEGAPKDRFQIINLSPCDTGPIDMVIDLSSSPAGLYFDTTATGAGVEVFQPFEIVEGADYVDGVRPISDGDTQAIITLSSLPGEAVVAFTTDLDDRMENSVSGQTRIGGSEIVGAALRIQAAGGTETMATFDTRGQATAERQACMS